ncbi:hypothetical protein RRG08_026604 [Elysia crispata]|uniref:Uncharacterized protein n=1 Tax=Elysia crispata TaxID=231223 RepID=A0AAE1B002_9GAST|nr:hypothetical protein RRG08_026604 [Elysia crispata]
MSRGVRAGDAGLNSFNLDLSKCSTTVLVPLSCGEWWRHILCFIRSPISLCPRQTSGPCQAVITARTVINRAELTE